MTNLDERGAADSYDIAVIGMVGRFPGARDLETFWRNLQAGIESIAPADEQELRAAGIDAAVLRAPGVVNAAARIDDIELFDAAFFGYSPKEAEVMDPQQRLFLECAWEALEHAGYDPETFKGLIGLYAGIGLNTYLLHLLPALDASGAVDGLQVTIGNDKDYLTTRASYKLNLRGPSVCVQTACSTSLVAVHLACQSLLAYECDMALAGGVSVRAPQPLTYTYQEGSILSSDGHCRAFDAGAQGTVFGNGIGMVVLKRLDDALSHGDTIHAVIKGSAINNDGAVKVGYTAPSMEGQAAVIRSALGLANVDPATISYIEAHGTGTALGDPIEISALSQVFRAATDRQQFCALGSVKTNIGHLDTAAGMAGLIKTVLALKHQQIPPSLHFERPNPQIDFASSPFYVNTRLADWPRGDTPRRAGVSSFGIGGTNAHLVLEEPPALAPSDPAQPWQLLLLSARSEAALKTAAANLQRYLQHHPEANLADVAYTLQRGRRVFAARRALVCRDVQDAITALSGIDPARILTAPAPSGARSIVFMFPGQGAQYPNMAAELYQREPVFRAAVDRCCALLQRQLGRDLRELLYPAAEQLAAATEELNQTRWTQPALFVIEYALAQLWLSWGLQPAGMIGHSIGEYVAATLAGVFALEDALQLVAQRGQLMQQLPPGAMLAVSLPELELRALLDAEAARSLALAAVNAPRLCVVSGPPHEIQALHERLSAQQVQCQLLHTSHAFHSAMMDPILEPFTQAVRAVRLHAPRIPFISNLTGSWITAAQATDPAYWSHHLRQTVRFEAGLQQLLQQPSLTLLEVGPGQTLGKLARQQPLDTARTIVLASLPHAQDRQSDSEFLLTTLGKLWLSDASINWTTVATDQRRRRVPLPTYPFERQRYWIDLDPQASTAGVRPRAGKRKPIGEWLYAPFWRRALPASTLPLRAAQDGAACWLIFADRFGLGQQLAQQLEQQGEPATLVQPGISFAQHDEQRYTIEPARGSDYERLLKALQQAGRAPHTIVHLWSLTDADGPLDQIAVEAAQQLGFESLLLLAQALGNRGAATPVQLGVVTNRLHSVLGSEQLRPEQATLLGSCKVIPQEYADLACRCIEIELPASATAREDVALAISQELKADSSDALVAYRSRQRWTQLLEPITLGASRSGSRVRERGVYLITGGHGGLGLALAEHLARTHHARLVLLSRNGLPPRAEWPQDWAAQPADDPLSQKLRQVQALEQLGAEVLHISADVTDVGQLRAALDQVRQRFGALHGVFHLAGVPGGGLIQLKTAEAARAILAPKMLGALALDQALADTPLDFMLLFSSITAITGGLGQVDYCAANAFLDAFAHARSQRGAPTSTIDWDAWQWDTWQTASMAALPEVQAQFKRLREQYGISFEEGHAVLDTLMQHLLPQVVVSTRDLHVTISDHQRFSQAMWRKQSPAGAASYDRLLSADSYVAPRNEVEQIIAEIWQAALGIEQVGIYDDFIELGGHSLLAIQVIARLRETFEIELPLRSLFEQNTVARLATTITAIILEEVERLSQDEVQEQLAEPVE